MSRIVAGFLLMLGIVLHAQVTRQLEPTAHQPLVVNGNAVSTTVLARGDRYYVDLEDIAKVLGATLIIKPTGISLNVNLGSLDSAKTTGSVKGNCTYFFNENYGSRADSASKVWLIRGTISVPTTMHLLEPDNDRLAIFDGSQGKNLDIVKSTLTDGNGSFEFDNVSPGEYTVIARSSHTKGTLGGRTVAETVTPRDHANRVSTQTITLKAGDVVDASHDFGANSY